MKVIVQGPEKSEEVLASKEFRWLIHDIHHKLFY
jgi:hypothetical protein